MGYKYNETTDQVVYDDDGNLDGLARWLDITDEEAEDLLVEPIDPTGEDQSELEDDADGIVDPVAPAEVILADGTQPPVGDDGIPILTQAESTTAEATEIAEVIEESKPAATEPAKPARKRAASKPKTEEPADADAYAAAGLDISVPEAE